MPSRDGPIHDRALFDALVAHMRVTEPELRIGSMFGCPAAFLGRRLAFCVFGAAVGVKVPAVEAARLIEFRDSHGLQAIWPAAHAGVDRGAGETG